MLRAFGKRFIYFLIAALLLAQQGVALHALWHGVDALNALKVASRERPDQRAPVSDRHCDLCLTYAQAAAGAAATTAGVFVAALEHVAPQTSVQPTVAHFSRAYRSRAPPRLA